MRRRAEACWEEAAEKINIHHSDYLSADAAPGVSGPLPVSRILKNVTPVRRLLPYIKRYRRQFALGFVCLLIASSVFAVVPRVLQFAIDDLYRGVTQAKLGRYSGLLLLIAAVGGYFRYQMRRIIISASRGFEFDLRNDFFAHLETLPLSFFQANRTGDLMSRATNDLSAVRMMVGPAVMYLANTIVTAVVSLSLMFALDARLTLIALIP